MEEAQEKPVDTQDDDRVNIKPQLTKELYEIAKLGKKTIAEAMNNLSKFALGEAANNPRLMLYILTAPVAFMLSDLAISMSLNDEHKNSSEACFDTIVNLAKVFLSMYEDSDQPTKTHNATATTH